MAMITELNCNIREAVHVKYLDGNLFSQDVYGNAIRVIVMDGDEPATLAGTVSGTAIREDGSTVALTDSRIDENVATVVLPAAAYAVPGVLAITIKISDTNTVTTLAYVVANVYRTSTDTVVDPGTIIPSITSLIEQIAEAVASIPADYSSLWAALAETFNASKSGGYAVGEYVTYDGGLYRFKNAHTGSWSSSDVDAVNLGSGIAKNASDISDLKSALNTETEAINASTGIKAIGLIQGQYRMATEGNTIGNTEIESSTLLMTCKVPCQEGDIFTISGAGSSGLYRLYCFANSSNKSLFISNANLADGVYTAIAPAGSAYILVDILLTSSNPYVFKGRDIVSEFKETDKNIIGSVNAVSGAKYHLFKYGYYTTPEDESPVEYIYHKEMVCCKFPVTAGQKILINATGNTGTGRLYVFIDEDGNAIGRCGTYLSGIRELTAPSGENVAYCAVNNMVTTQPEGYYALTEIPEKDGYVTEEIEQGAYNSSGEPGRSEYYCRTEKIDIDSILNFVKPVGMNCIVCRYEADGTFISRTSTGTTAADYDHYEVVANFATSETKYLAFAVDRYVDGVEVKSSPQDILNGGFKIKIGNFSTLYPLIRDAENRIKTLEDYKTQSIPSYYTETDTETYGSNKNYLNDRIQTIVERSNNLGTNSDSFIFITDYHGTLSTSNTRNSPALIREIVKQTGISHLVFGGDAGRTLQYTDYRNWWSAKENAEVYQILSECAPEFDGILGNHEWNSTQSLTSGELIPQSYCYTREGVCQYYLKRANVNGIEMDAEGNYYKDNKRAKIRYFYLQNDPFAGLTNNTCKWLGEQLESVPDGYAVLVFAHLGYLDQYNYISGGVRREHYKSLEPGTISGIVNLSVKRVSVLLNAFQHHTDGTISMYDAGGHIISGQDETYHYGQTNGSVIGIICGHTHRDMVLEKADSSDEVLVIATTTDSIANNEDYNSEGELVTRERGTITEQAFDVVQIDMNTKTIYMTRIGGGSDRTKSFADIEET